MMLHLEYQGSMPCGFRQEDFSCVSYISLCKTCDPWSGVIFGTRGIGLLGDAIYQISRLYAMLLLTRDVSMFSLHMHV